MFTTRFELMDGRTVVLAIADDAQTCAVKIGTDPNLLVAHRGRIHDAVRAEAIADCCRAAETPT